MHHDGRWRPLRRSFAREDLEMRSETLPQELREKYFAYLPRVLKIVYGTRSF